MQKRFISFMLALIYLSVSIAFAAPHAHDHSKPLPEQCVACGWHSDSNTDVPTTPALIRAPKSFTAQTPHANPHLHSSTPRSQHDRGPPHHS